MFVLNNVRCLLYYKAQISSNKAQVWKILIFRTVILRKRIKKLVLLTIF